MVIETAHPKERPSSVGATSPLPGCAGRGQHPVHPHAPAWVPILRSADALIRNAKTPYEGTEFLVRPHPPISLNDF